MFDKVEKSLKDGFIVGVDFTGIEFLDRECERRLRVWVYKNSHKFIPELAYEATLLEKEVAELFNRFNDLWINDDHDPHTGVKTRYVAAVEPCGRGFLK